ncbi:MAG: trimethylamine methyltransferase family protein [Gemmatimonadota bacterium]|nr:MAG: trimethylamine methyltransferase family protein [Gemmatimonadota bacterium]
MPVRAPMTLSYWDVLTEDQVRKLHADTLVVLEQTGVEVHEERSLQLLTRAGATVDGARVRVPAPLVEQALSTAPKEITICDREGEPAMRLAPGYIYFGTGSDTTWVIDPETGERRRTDLDSIRMTTRLTDALPNLDFAMSMGTAPEIAPELADQHHFAAMVESTTKPLMFTVQSERAAVDIAAMCALVSGDGESFRKRPFAMLYAMPTAPLYHTAEALSALLVCADTGIPAVYSSAPQYGATGPITIAGSLVVANAEMLSGLVIQQLHRPGAPFIHGPIVGPLDMRTMVNNYCGPAADLGLVAGAQLGRHYGMPVFGVGGSSDSKLFDQQATAEASIQLIMSALAGVNLIHDVGYLESGLTASPEAMTYMDEMIDQVRFILRGVVVSDQANLLADIEEVGPRGSFLMRDSTLQRFREAMWMGPLTDRRRYEEWVSSGAMDAGARTRARTLALLKDHQPRRLDQTTQERLWRKAAGHDG